MTSEYQAWLYLQGYEGRPNPEVLEVGEGNVDDSSSWQLVPLSSSKGAEGEAVGQLGQRVERPAHGHTGACEGNTKQREDIVMEILSLIGTLVLVGFISWLVVPILVGLVVFAVYLALLPFRILFNLLRGGD